MLTGESMPVTKRVGTLIYSGSIVKQGEMDGVSGELEGSTSQGVHSEH